VYKRQLKQLITTAFDDHLATAIPDPEALDQVWTSGAKSRGPLENTVISMMRELAKLNPQGSVHAQDLYATVNLVRRTPPGPILSLLVDRPWSSHMGDLYFRLNENIQEENTHD
jgi:N12 class adenine-specific DNA methylase